MQGPTELEQPECLKFPFREAHRASKGSGGSRVQV